jgi:hypothetical protein
VGLEASAAAGAAPFLATGSIYEENEEDEKEEEEEELAAAGASYLGAVGAVAVAETDGRGLGVEAGASALMLLVGPSNLKAGALYSGTVRSVGDPLRDP